MLSTLVEPLTAEEYNQVTRAYLLALRAGQQPLRPDCGPFWSPLVDILEEFAVKYQGNPKTIADAFAGVAAGNASLDDLIAPSSSVQPLQGVPALPKSAQLPAELAYGACDWLDWYVEFSRQASDRAYDGFHVFVGLWLLSVVAARRTYLQIKRKRFYTNLMIGLFAETSFYAKSFTVQVAKEILSEMELDHLLAPNRITPQKLWSDMSGVNIPVHYDEMKPMLQEHIRQERAMSGQVGLVFDEFGKFVQNMLRKQSTNAEFVEMFLEFDACPPRYENATISRNGEPIAKPYIALIGNITPPNLKENARAGADFWQDGFWARFSFVVAPPATEEMIKDDDDADDDDALPIPPKILHTLLDWHRQLGIPECYIDPIRKDDKETGRYSIERQDLPETPCSITTEAKRAWKHYETALRRMSLTFPHSDFRGSYTRLPETAMRIAVILASLSNNNRIEIRHWAKAQELAEVLRHNLHELYTQVNETDNAPTREAAIEQRIIDLLERKGPSMSVRDIYQCLRKSYSTMQLQEAVNHLTRLGELQKIISPQGEKYRKAKQ